MKIKHLFPIFILLALGTISSCNLLDKADDISFDAELPLEFVIDEQAVNPNGKSYSITKTLDATTDPDVAKYASKIKEFKVNKITYSISAVTPSGVTFNNGKLIIGTKTIATAGNVSITPVSDVELTADVAGFNELASKLIADKQAEIKLDGAFTATPIKFTLSCKFFVTITADAL
jgi:hypothetical protein